MDWLPPSFTNFPSDLGSTVTPTKAATVSQLTERIKQSLELAFPDVWVAGEISNLSRPASGHVYFTLKDDRAQLRATIWHSTATRLKFDPRDGLEVVCHGEIDVYPPRGSYQLIVRRVEPVGLGALQLAFRQLHQRLSAEGLFDPRRKRTLPRFPRRIAFVTSPTGAAFRDFLEVLRRRWRGIEVILIPARVQGEGASQDIANGVRLANRLTPPIDVLVVGRGGGSQEDLWCFNEEPVVRAVAASYVPVISAVGHEIDVTLCDLAADVRALTPSEAAERIAPSMEEALADARSLGLRMERAMLSRLATARERLESLAQRRALRRPLDLVHNLGRRLDELELRAGRSLKRQHVLADKRLLFAAQRLESLSPLAVLARGYSITERADKSGEVLRSAAHASLGELLKTRLSEGEVISRVERVETRLSSLQPS